ncbi:MAG: hypothetical protein IJW18_06900 [Lachnospiraceae bacterium]|nr:hypothetical protein [Lachnospiraceae bacterium]
MTREKKQDNNIVKEMVLGILAVNLLVAIIGLIFVPQRVVFLIGLLMGLVVAVLMILSMKHSIEKAMDFGEKGAKLQTIKGYAFRTVLVVAGFVGAYFIGIWAMASFFLGVMSMKAAAYMQPYTKKFLHH